MPDLERASPGCDSVRRRLEEIGLLLLQDKKLPSVAGIFTGETLTRSWWSHPRAHEIFRCLGQLENEALVTRLIAGKVTYVHRRLWPAFLAVATSNESWQRPASGATPRELQQRLAVHAEEVHTASGRHEVRIESWNDWAKRMRVQPLADLASARAAIEHAARILGATERMLPWNRSWQNALP